MRVTAQKLLLFLFLPYYGYSQYEVIGVVKDSTNNPIEFANVVLTNELNKIVVGTITSKDGQFKLSTRKGDYKLVISFIGYKSFNKSIYLIENLNLKDINLIESYSKLHEITVIGEKKLIEQKVDRLIFNLSYSPFIRGKNALQSLSLAPGVWTSSNGEISINGRGDTKIMVNNKLLRKEVVQEYLRNLRAEDIDKIEIIEHPPAEFDASGASGIIHIILKKDIKSGLNGTIYTNYTQHRFPSFDEGVSINFKKDKWLWYGSYNYERNKSFFDRKIDFFYQPENIKQKNIFKSTRKRKGNTFRAGFDYNPSSKQRIGFEYYNNIYDTKEDLYNRSTSSSVNTINEIVKGIYPGRFDAKKESFNLNYQWEIDTTGRQLSVLADHYTYNRIDKTDYNDSIFDGNNVFLKDETLKSLTDGDITVFTAKIDYKHPIKKWGELQSGFKYSNAGLKNINVFEFLENGVFEIDENRTNTFEYKEHILAAYLKATKKILGIDVQVGLRGEYTEGKGYQITNNQINKRNYFNLFPSFFAKHYINKKKNHSIKYYYGRRISRPSYSWMNPFESYTNRNSIYRGNPGLQPEYINFYSISYVVQNKYSLRLHHAYNRDIFSEVDIRDSSNTNINIETAENIGKQFAYGLYFNYSYTLTKWWETTTGISLGYADVSSYDKSFQKSITTFFMSHRSNMTLPWGMQGTLNLRYSPPLIDGIYTFGTIFNMNIGIQKSVFKDKGTIALDMNDVFYTSGRYNFKSNYMQQKTMYDITRSSQAFTLSFSYNFSLGDKFKRQQKENSNDDELDRID